MREITLKTLRKFEQAKQYFCNHNIEFFNTDLGEVKVFKNGNKYYIIDNIRYSHDSEKTYLIKEFNPENKMGSFKNIKEFKSLQEAVQYVNTEIKCPK